MEKELLNKLMKLSEDMSGKTHFLEAICKDDMGVSLESLGLTQEDLSNEEYWFEVDKNEITKYNKESFKTINLYKYVST